MRITLPFPRPARVWLAFSALLLLPFALIAEKPFSFAETPGQLPKTAVPRHYALRLQADLEQQTTLGTARIEFEVFAPLREITLNALELDITDVSLVDDPARAMPLKATLNAGNQTVTVAVPEGLSPGRHTLSFAYRGKIGLQAQGLFVDKYPSPSGEKRMLGSQMEPTDARRVFPCWDEPVYRATYDITLIVREKLMAVANMPMVREQPLPSLPGWKEVVFARSPAMPSYLVALFAGEFETVEGEQDGVKLRVLTTEGKRASGAYTLESTKRILAYYNQYFGAKYPLPKLDQIAVPSAFSTFSAMENWGCIAYIDTAILFDPKASSQARREDVFQTVAHEVAHQWFGNLVTMAWWDNLWLNEGFASWMGTKCSDALNPEWQLWLRANGEKERAMELDARKTTHPVQQPVASESQANDAFDVIAYQKGQSFLRMLESYLGADTFRAGIRLYISRHPYSNTTTADLWAALAQASGKPVVALAAGWTEQPGFPLVSLSVTGSGADRAIKIEQSRFTLNDPAAAPLQWKIPVTVASLATPGAPSVRLLEGPADRLPWPAGEGAVKANVGDTGYYRVWYDDQLAALLHQQATSLPVGDQLNLLADTWALVEAGRAASSAWFDLAERLAGTRSQPVLSAIIERLDFVNFLQTGQPGRPAFQAWVVQTLAPQLARLGWAPVKDESPLDGSLRSALAGILGRCGDAAVLAESTRRFEAALKDPASLAGDLRGPVLANVGRRANRETYDKLHDLARRALATEEKRDAYAAMQAASDPALARETLAMSLGTEMSVSESTKNVARIAEAGHGALAWDYARANMEALLKQVTMFGRNSYVPDIMRFFTDAARADELEAYVRKNSPPDAFPEAAKTSDRIRHFAIVKQRELPAIDAWIKSRGKMSDSGQK